MLAEFNDSVITKKLSDTTEVSGESDLINIKIEEVYQEPKGEKKFYALAIIDKKETMPIIAKKIEDNLSNVKIYIDRARNENDLLKKFSLLDKATFFADKTENFIIQSKILGNIDVELEEIYSSEQLKSQADAVAQEISFGVNINSELAIKCGIDLKIKDVFSKLKMKISPTPNYILDTDISFDVDHQQDLNAYMSKCNIQFNLKDNNDIILTTFLLNSGRNVAHDENKANELSLRSIKIEKLLLEQFSIYLNKILQ